METKALTVIDIETGENLPIEKATDRQVSRFLADLKGKKEQLDKVEKKIKQHILEERGLVFEEKESGARSAKFEDHTIREQQRLTFDKKMFDKNATEEEKSFVDEAEEIKKKYQKVTIYKVFS